MPRGRRWSGHTRVDLVHRGLEAFRPDAATMRDVLGSPGGSPGVLGACVALAVGV